MKRTRPDDTGRPEQCDAACPPLLLEHMVKARQATGRWRLQSSTLTSVQATRPPKAMLLLNAIELSRNAI